MPGTRECQHQRILYQSPLGSNVVIQATVQDSTLGGITLYWAVLSNQSNFLICYRGVIIHEFGAKNKEIWWSSFVVMNILSKSMRAKQYTPKYYETYSYPS